MAFERICLYCGSSAGKDERYAAAAVDFGRAVVAAGCGLVYGGAAVGLMGVVADTVLAAGGAVVGVMTDDLVKREKIHRGVTRLEVVDTLSERKARMADLSDAFVALPGGFGTLDELFETVTWTQLGIHTKPVGLLDVAGYWDGLAAFLDHAAAAGFVRTEHRDILLADDDPARLLDRLAAWEPPAVTKWADRRDR